jgi:hypothetical protein
MRLGGITADADLTPASWTAAIQQAKQRGVKPLVSEHGLFFRVPITNDVATYFIDEKYDARALTDVKVAFVRARKPEKQEEFGSNEDDCVRNRDHLDLCLTPIDEQFNPIDKTALI